MGDASDEFATVNLRRGEWAREVEAKRQQYGRHRQALVEMVADAPTEHLAAEYRRLIGDLDEEVAKLDEMEGRRAGESPGLETSPGMQPLDGTLRDAPAEEGMGAALPSVDPPSSRLLLIVVVAIVGLGLFGWLIWRASSGRQVAATGVTGTISEQPTATESASADTQPPPAPVVPTLAVEPPSRDYGVIRKGTRATRQFDVTNSSDRPVPIVVSRSACHCLYYEYPAVVPPQGKVPLTVTIDGARVKAGALREAITVTKKGDPKVEATFDVTATVG